jgi:hypothetical protein
LERLASLVGFVLMRIGCLLAGVCGAALILAAPGLARQDTTNEPAIFTVKVTLTDSAVRISPNHAARGSYCTFLITNRGAKTHRFVIGDIRRGPGYGEGFARTLKPQQQRRIVMYLNYRGLLKYVDLLGAKTVARGVFRIT